jgi:hypothetical protein
MGRMQVIVWLPKFKSNVTSVEDGENLRGPVMSKTDKNMY